MSEAKILVLGAESVGKTAITVRFLTRRFIGEYESSIDHLYKQTVAFNEAHVNIEVLDTCTKLDFVRKREDHMRWADGMILVYSVCNRETFDSLDQQIKRAQSAKAPSSISIAVVANKIDLDQNCHEVNSEEGHDLAEEYGCHFFEVSAAENWESVWRAFSAVVKDVDEEKKHREQIRRRKSSVTKNVANKVRQAMFGSPMRRRRKISVP
ncbi:ras-related and estrogen-regulated growth inhibitor-like [Apostichopus japonicus]|uniref:ras-related and estrogen-regulated growth inhibitor-like n=1 Tax=Stichopus japonicus TaxID=307972 RepID=UPI003AB8A1F6